MSAAGESRLLRNAAGEPERDRYSPRANLGEAFALYAVAALALWGLVGALGRARGSPLGLAAGYALLAACGLYAFALAPWLHGERPETWGLPRRGSLRVRVRGLDREGRRRLALAGAGLAALLVLALARGWPNLLVRLGVRRHFGEAFAWLTGTAPGALLGIAAGVVILLPALALAVRWDNLASAARGLAPTALLLWGGVIALALARAALTGDWSGFDRGQWLAVDPDRTATVFYLLWGFAQQALFLGYFNARLRKGIGPGRRGPLTGRLLAALLTGALFALAHLPATLLVAGTFVAGTAFGWHFQVDRTRNLFAMALIHAVAGTLFSALLPVSMEVGP